MYESYYGLSGNPFRLRPDPAFFFSSKGHQRAMRYLEYGLAQREGFIVITGEVGAGKTTLARKLLGQLAPEKIVHAHLANTHLDPENTLKMVAGAFGLPFEDASKAALLMRLEQFFRSCDKKGQRVLLVIDEAQNLTLKSLEELRMLSNFQTADQSLLQTFLLGQPEFRKMLHSKGMQQLRQRVIATYHLGPMDAAETRNYIEHRLRTVGWQNNPSFSTEAFDAIFAYTAGVPRAINTLCERLLLMGYLEEIHAFGVAEVNEVIRDVQQEFSLPEEDTDGSAHSALALLENGHDAGLQQDLHDRLAKLERTTVSVLKVLKELVSPSPIDNLPDENIP
jgi:general secretion pathway protein A